MAKATDSRVAIDAFGFFREDDRFCRCLVRAEEGGDGTNDDAVHWIRVRSCP